MSKADLLIFHDALCFMLKYDLMDKFEKYLRRNLRGSPEAYNEFVEGRKPDGHELIGRISTILIEMEDET